MGIEETGNATSLPIGEAHFDSADTVIGVQGAHRRQVGCITHDCTQRARGERSGTASAKGHDLILGKEVFARGNCEARAFDISEFAIGTVTADISSGPTN